MSAPARILIVDDHPLIREGLAARISACPDLAVCGEAANVDEALGLVRTTEPDLIIVDLALTTGHGLDLIKRIKHSRAGTKLLVLTAYDEALFAARALRAGAHGYVGKQEAQQTLIGAIRKVLKGEHYLSPKMTQRLIGEAVGGKDVPLTVEDLSDRELQIFELIGRGIATRKIAEHLKLSVHTIETHRERIRAKLGLRNGAELTQRAVHWVVKRV